MNESERVEGLVYQIVNWHLERYPDVGKQQLNPESLLAIELLANSILLPIIDVFGSIDITYGYTSLSLLRQIQKKNPKGIAPKLDQHASHETYLNGNPICPRLGAAVDFIVKEKTTNMASVSQWVSEHSAYDRLYFYGEKMPIHLTIGPENSRSIQIMNVSNNGKRFPGKRVTKKLFNTVYSAKNV